jgi:putative transcriptional regulator
MDIKKSSFGKVTNRLKLARVANGDLTQQQLADLVECSRQTIISIESSKFLPSIELALKLAKALNTPVDQIFFLDEVSNKQN